MTGRFTRAARAVVVAAVAESERRGDQHVGTEHLLLSLTATGAGVDPADALLRRLGIDPAALRERLQRRLRAAS